MKHVYIVDDDEEVRNSLSFFLVAAGFTPRTYCSGDQFVSGYIALEAGCVLLDVRMPGMDGFEVIAATSALRLRLPTIVMTGHGDIVTAVRAMKAGALDFIEKPFEDGLLLESLMRAFVYIDDYTKGQGRLTDAKYRIESLSERELEVLVGLVAGKPNKLIAYNLGISVRTIEMHRAAMMVRLGVRSLGEAIRMAFDSGVGIVASATDTIVR